MTTPNYSSLEDKLQAHGNPVDMLRHSPTGGYEFPFPAQYTNWRDEQEAWQKSVVLFDQSFHMTDVYFEGPNAYYSILPFDKVLLGDKMVGLSTYTVYTSNVRCWFSLAMLDEDVPDGAEVKVVWGEEDGGSKKPIVERHAQTEIRATVSYQRLNED